MSLTFALEKDQNLASRILQLDVVSTVVKLFSLYRVVLTPLNLGCLL